MFQMVSEARSAVTDVTRDAGPGDRDAATAGFGGEQVTPVQHLGLGATGETGGGVPQRRPSAGTTAETVATGDGILVTRDSQGQVQNLRRKRKTQRGSRTLQSARGAAAVLMPNQGDATTAC